MATSYYPPGPSPLPYAPYQAPVYTGGQVDYRNAQDPRQVAQNQRAMVQSQADQLQNTDEQLANQYAAQQSGTQQYLNPIESTLASGGGGYAPSEVSQIELTPQQQQDIVTGAGISAGAGTASAVGAADRAAAASGGNPAAMATYRQRAAQTEGANAGDAMTQAKIAAQQAGAAGAEQVGQARMGQQGAALQYYGGLQSEQGQQGLSEQGLGQGAFSTGVSGTGQAAGLQLNAAQQPTATDKIIGGIAGAASAFLEDGKPGDGGDAVVAEAGPEAIVDAASDPVRSHTTFMADGYYDTDDPGNSGTQPNPFAPMPSSAAMPAPGTPGPQSSWLQQYLANVGKDKAPQQQQPAPGQPGWNKTTPYSQLGTAIGSAAKGLFHPGGGGSALSPNPFAPGSSQMPGAGGSPAPTYGSAPTAPYTLPGGLINRTGSTIDGTPSMGSMSQPANSYIRSALQNSDGSWSPDGGPIMRVGPSQNGAQGDALAEDVDSSINFESDGRMPYMADGAAAPKPPMILTRPTRVHLEKTDAVIPLSYRPKAKIRPSAAMAAMQPRMRQPFGARV